MTAVPRLTGCLLLIVVTGLLPGWTSPGAVRQAQASARMAGVGVQISAAKPNLVTVKVAMLPYISFAPFYIAQEEGFFAQQGLKVELVNIADQVNIIPALASGQVDVSSGLVSAGILNTIKQSGTIKIVADKGYIDPTSCDGGPRDWVGQQRVGRLRGPAS